MKVLRKYNNYAIIFAVTSLPALMNSICAANSGSHFEYARATFDSLIVKDEMYLRGDCFDPKYDFRGYEGLPVTECIYSAHELDGRVFLLDLANEQFARWTVSGCEKFAAERVRACIAYTAKWIKTQSGGQFPVAGVVVESASVVGGPSDVGMYFVFRDGVTVRTVLGLNGTTRQLTERQMEALTTAEVVDAKKYARVVSATREDYTAIGGTVDVGRSAIGKRKIAWLDVVRNAYADAWNAATNVIFDARISRAVRGSEF